MGSGGAGSGVPARSAERKEVGETEPGEKAPCQGDADFPGWRGTNYCSQVGRLVVPHCGA